MASRQSRSSRRRPAALAATVLLSAAAAAAPGAVKTWIADFGTWGVGSNWSPNGSPTGVDSVVIGASLLAQNGIVSLDVNPFVLGLQLSDGMILDTNARPVVVSGLTSVSGDNSGQAGGFTTRIQLFRGAGPFDLLTTNLSVADGARIELIDGGIVNVSGAATIEATGQIGGRGVMNFSGNAGPVFVLNGTLSVSVDGTTLNQTGAGRIDLDGTSINDGTINLFGRSGFGATAKFQTLTINGDTLNDAFDDEFRIGRGNVLNMNLTDGWSLGALGRIQFVDTNYFADGVVNGGTINVSGIIESQDGGLGDIGTMTPIINAPLVFNIGSDVLVGSRDVMTFNGPTTVNAGSFNLAHRAVLAINGATTLAGGTFTTHNTTPADGEVRLNGPTTWRGNVAIDGILRQNGDATVSQATVITAGLLDFDGEAEAAQDWTINAPLTISAGALEVGGDNVHDGRIAINSPLPGTAGLTVNLPAGGNWTSGGTLNLAGASTFGFATVVAGSDVRLAGVTTVNNAAAIAARAEFAAGGTTTIAAGGNLRLLGGGTNALNANRISGGAIGGSGTLSATAGKALWGFGMISSAVDFVDADLFADGGTLSVTGSLVRGGVVGTRSATSTLRITQPWNTGNVTRLELNAGTMLGASITNGGLTTGRGWIGTGGFVNNGTITVTGNGSLTIDTINAPDLDGATNTGVLNVTSGNLRVADLPADAFGGTANVGANRTLQLDAGWAIETGGALNLTATSPNVATVAGAQQAVQGAINVSGRGALDIPTTLFPGAAVSITGGLARLSLLQDATISSGVTITGTGTLLNAAGATLRLLPGANANVPLSNEGTLAIGPAGPAGAAAARFSQSAGGRLEASLAGTTPASQFDRLNVTETAVVNGTIALSTAGGYDPAYGISHEVILATGGVSGYFTSVEGLVLSPLKYLAVTYDADSVFVTAAIPGDANIDGVVNIADFAILASQFNTPGPWAQGNFNGDDITNIADFSLLAGNFNTSAQGAPFARFGALPAYRPAAVPEPGVAAGLAAAAGVLLGRRRRR